MLIRRCAAMLAFGIALSLAVCASRGESATVTESPNASISGGAAADWPTYNGDLKSTRYSTLTQITSDNVAKLHKICAAPLKEQGAFQAEPIILSGTIYVPTAHETYAIDGKSCKVKWSAHYTSKQREPFPVDRGVAIIDGKVIRGTPDGHVIALDQNSGKTLWDSRLGNGDKGEFVSSAPIAYNHSVYVGVAGADWGVMGRMTALDPSNGKTKWTFTTIAHGSDPNAKSWPDAVAAQRGGGGLWTSYSIDPATNTLYIPVSNPAPDFVGTVRKGANLYTNSIVALDATTGALKWYVQTVPHDLHDWDQAAAPVVYTAGGTPMLGAPGKDGRLYGIDAATHKIAYATTEVRRSDQNAPVTIAGTHMCPGPVGGSEWNGAAFDQKNNLLITPMDDWCATVKLGSLRYTPGQFYLGGALEMDAYVQAKGALTATDPATGKVRWKYASHSPMLAGVTPAASGLTFTGDMAGNLLVLDSASGKVLYKHTTQGSIAGGVVPFEADGSEYLAVTSGNISRLTWGNHGTPTLLVYGL